MDFDHSLENVIFSNRRLNRCNRKLNKNICISIFYHLAYNCACTSTFPLVGASHYLSLAYCYWIINSFPSFILIFSGRSSTVRYCIMLDRFSSCPASPPASSAVGFPHGSWIQFQFECCPRARGKGTDEPQHHQPNIRF